MFIEATANWTLMIGIAFKIWLIIGENSEPEGN